MYSFFCLPSFCLFWMNPAILSSMPKFDANFIQMIRSCSSYCGPPRSNSSCISKGVGSPAQGRFLSTLFDLAWPSPSPSLSPLTVILLKEKKLVEPNPDPAWGRPIGCWSSSCFRDLFALSSGALWRDQHYFLPKPFIDITPAHFILLAQCGNQIERLKHNLIISSVLILGWDIKSNYEIDIDSHAISYLHRPPKLLQKTNTQSPIDTLIINILGVPSSAWKTYMPHQSVDPSLLTPSSPMLYLQRLELSAPSPYLLLCLSKNTLYPIQRAFSVQEPLY